MKKKYSLDYSIERDIDRLAAVEQILDTLESNPTPSELEQMASLETRVLIDDLRSIINNARNLVAATANHTLTMMYWHIGKRIEF